MFHFFLLSQPLALIFILFCGNKATLFEKKKKNCDPRLAEQIETEKSIPSTKLQFTNVNKHFH